MLLEYVSRRISRVRFATDAETSSQSTAKWFCGTYGHSGKTGNSVSIWGYEPYKERNGSVDRAVDRTDRPDSTQLRIYGSHVVSSDVSQLVAIDDSLLAVTQHDGCVTCFAHSSDSLRLRHKWPNVHHSCKDGVLNRFTNELMVCGDDGFLSAINVEMGGLKRMTCVSQNSIECVDVLTGDQLVCGTSSGHLKVYDLRNERTVMSMANDQSIISCVQRNPHTSHVVVCGNDVGVISLWDTRNTGKQLMSVSAHNAFISQMLYKANEANILLTSSYDGQLLRWSISPASQLLSVDAILSRAGGSPINSFDVNPNDEIIFSADNEVLYFGRL